MEPKYDYLIVGAGFFGATFAHEMHKRGFKCLVIDKRSHIAGNCYTDERDGINLHIYGPHIFHTNDRRIWDWIRGFGEFHQYKHSPKVSHSGRIYSFPINLMTLHQIYGVRTPEEGRAILASKTQGYDPQASDLEGWCLSQIGPELYEIFIKGYTQKQWGRDPKELPSSIIKRLPVRFNYDDNYFFDKYQGIPVGGYTQLFEKILDGIEVRLNTDYFTHKEELHSLAKRVVYTGPIDAYFDYQHGPLDYRTLKFEVERLEQEDHQGCSIVNWTSADVPWTRTTEHCHFEGGSKGPHTWVTKEFPKEYASGDEPYYPINDESNQRKFKLYRDLARQETGVIFGGRLAEYRYYDMHQIIASALKAVEDELS